MIRLGARLPDSQVLIGAAVLIMVMVAIGVASRASPELPLMPHYDLRVEVPDAALLTKGAEVYVGPARVGTVTEVQPSGRRYGRPTARLRLRLERDLEPLPRDSVFRVRPRGAIARKALQIHVGRAPRGWADGATVPLSRSRSTVELDQVLGMFTERTRVGAKRSMEGFGLGLAGRGQSLNEAIEAFVPTLGYLRPVMRNLADPRTDLGGFFVASHRLAAELAPVATEQARAVAALDVTFGALAKVARPYLQQAISEAPATESAVTRQLPRARPFLRTTTRLMASLQPGTSQLASASPELAGAVEAGVRTLPAVPGLARNTDALVARIERYSNTADVRGGLQRTAQTSRSLEPLLTFLRPAQTVCNYPALLVRNLASLATEDIATGTFLRVGGVVIERDANSERGPASAPYAGRDRPGDALGPLHSNAYPSTAAPGQPRECEAGRENYVHNRVVIGNVPGNQGLKTEAGSLP